MSFPRQFCGWAVVTAHRGLVKGSRFLAENSIHENLFSVRKFSNDLDENLHHWLMTLNVFLESEVIDLTSKGLKKVPKLEDSQSVKVLLLDDNELQKIDNIDSFLRIEKVEGRASDESNTNSNFFTLLLALFEEQSDTSNVRHKPIERAPRIEPQLQWYFDYRGFKRMFTLDAFKLRRKLN